MVGTTPAARALDTRKILRALVLVSRFGTVAACMIHDEIDFCLVGLMPLGALYPSKSGLMNKHIVKHIVQKILMGRASLGGA